MRCMRLYKALVNVYLLCVWNSDESGNTVTVLCVLSMVIRLLVEEWFHPACSQTSDGVAS